MHNNHGDSAFGDNLQSIADERLAHLAAAGNSDALEEIIRRYKNLVRARARSYFLAGADTDDIIQEGMIGLFKAVRDFNPEMQTVFSAFAELCITRQIMTAVKTATRNKHMPLNTYVSLNRPLYDDEAERFLSDFIAEDSSLDPEAIMLAKEKNAALQNLIKTTLSPFEQNILALYFEGRPYQEIASALSTHTKAVDNALQRIKRKLAKSMNHII